MALLLHTPRIHAWPSTRPPISAAIGFCDTIPGAHGGAEKDGTPVIQYDVKTRRRKVLAFLHPAIYAKTGYIPIGTYGSAVSPEGDKLYITFNGNRGTKREDLDGRIRFNTCALAVIHIPESERRP